MKWDLFSIMLKNTKGNVIYYKYNWSGKRDSNSRPSRWQRDALPLSYSRIRTTDDNQRKRVFNPDMFPIAKKL